MGFSYHTHIPVVSLLGTSINYDDDDDNNNNSAKTKQNKTKNNWVYEKNNTSA